MLRENHNNKKSMCVNYTTLRKFIYPFNAWIQRGPGELGRYSDMLRAGRSRDRIPVGARFSATVQTGPGTNPPSYTTVTGSFQGVKWPGLGVEHPSCAEV